MNKPVLYIFIVSHFCEKARWALDYFNIDYEIKYLPPGVHILTAKRLGAPGTTVPILKKDKEVIQGSDNIIDWTQSVYSNDSKTLLPLNSSESYQNIEKRLDEIMGVHIRRYFYSEALIDHPDSVKETFSKNLSYINKTALNLTWKKVRDIMIKSMDLGHEQRIESKKIIDDELNWLDDLISDGREYLTGSSFSRADLTAASLISPIASPPEHPVYPELNLPPLMQSDIESWMESPTIKWVNKIYNKHRINL